jgi:hypothetical protein
MQKCLNNSDMIPKFTFEPRKLSEKTLKGDTSVKSTNVMRIRFNSGLNIIVYKSGLGQATVKNEIFLALLILRLS